MARTSSVLPDGKRFVKPSSAHPGLSFQLGRAGAEFHIESPEGPVALCVLSCENEDRRWVSENAGNLPWAEVA